MSDNKILYTEIYEENLSSDEFEGYYTDFYTIEIKFVSSKDTKDTKDTKIIFILECEGPYTSCEISKNVISIPSEELITVDSLNEKTKKIFIDPFSEEKIFPILVRKINQLKFTAE